MDAQRCRARVIIRGAVQGVGFRPFTARLASDLGIAGWIANTGHGVVIEAEADQPRLDEFLRRLDDDRPRHAVVVSRETTHLDPAGFHGFEIRDSTDDGAVSALILPDLATCADCLRELFDPGDRRHRYPFINCTHCGPRFSIIEGLPYDRARTSMKTFAMCDGCLAEYSDSADRRFHAQPNACPACGPSLALWTPDGDTLACANEALEEAVAAIADGAIVAVKGVGGFLLLADASREDAVRALRVRKRRDEKPFALLFPDLDAVARVCAVSPREARLLQSPEAPIVLLRRANGFASTIAPSVAPGNPYLGAMLPYAPLHHLLMRDLGRAVVATSGNVSDEPMCIDEREALERLGGIADVFLVHDRPIVRHVDDSIACVLLDREMVLRRARGYAPLPVMLSQPLDAPILSVGGHLKNSIAFGIGRSVFLSQHIGDLDSTQGAEAFERVIHAFRDLYRVEPQRVAADLHPDYVSTRYAERLGLPVVRVQHHAAHVASCMAENGIDGDALGVAWDGAGYGTDGSIWGGEFLVARDGRFDRVASWRPFRLPGSEAAIREPRRTAFGLLYEHLGAGVVARDDLAPVAAFRDAERHVLVRMLASGVNSPVTTSAGRLFDAAASLCGLNQRTSFEGQAAMAMEFAVDPRADGAYPVHVVDGRAADAAPPFVLDWHPLLECLLADVQRAVAVGTIAARFHASLADAIVEIAARVGLPRIVLSGGCFQNRLLTERVVERLRNSGFRPYWHQRVPANDGGIALGQAAIAAKGFACASPFPERLSASKA